jgi:L-malate glycosyltransferase
MKIGITCYPSVGGSGIIATTLGVELAARGHEVHFISYERPFRLPRDNERIFFHPVEVNGYELFRYPDYTLPLSVKMADVSRRFGLDVLHVHYAVPHATAAILARCMLAKERPPKVIATLHGTDTTLLGNDPGYAPAILHALENADAVTAVSNFLKTETQRVLGVARPIDVIHNFFEPAAPSRSRDEVRAELGIQPDETVIIHLSNLRPLKRIGLLLRSFARLRRRESCKLVILAGGDFEPYAGMVADLGLTKRVIVRRNVLDVENYLQAADLGLFTSETESFCLSILELMFFGIPSVSTRVGGIPEVAEDGVHGLLVNSAAPEDLAGAMDRLISEPALRAQLGRNGQERASTLFSTDTIVPRYEALYRRVLAVE